MADGGEWNCKAGQEGQESLRSRGQAARCVLFTPRNTVGVLTVAEAEAGSEPTMYAKLEAIEDRKAAARLEREAKAAADAKAEVCWC